MRSALRRLAPFLAAAIILTPLLRAPHNDTYPLSTYPMFATDRGADHTISTAVSIDERGEVSRLSPKLIAGTDEVVLAAVTVARAVGRGEVDELCAEILDRIDGPAHIIIRSETLDVVAHVVNGAEPRRIEVHAECESG